jgi:hypothetical protein
MKLATVVEDWINDFLNQTFAQTCTNIRFTFLAFLSLFSRHIIVSSTYYCNIAIS